MHRLLANRQKAGFVNKISLVFFYKILSAVLGMLLSLVLTRNVNPATYGEFSYFWNWAGLITTLIVFGHDISLLRAFAHVITNKDWPTLRGLINYACVWLLAVSPILSVLVASFIFYILFPLDRPLIDTLIVAALALSFTGKSIVSTILRSFQRPLFGELFQGLIPTALTLICVFIWIATREAGAESEDAAVLILLAAAATTISLLAAMPLIYRSLPSNYLAERPKYAVKKWWYDALPHLLLSGCSVILVKIDILFLGVWLSFSEVALYQVAVKVASVVTLVHYSITHVFAPMIAQLHTQEKHSELQGFLTTASFLMAAVTSVAALILLAFGEKILSLFGQEYGDAHSILIIIMSGVLVNALCGPVGFIATMTGHARQATFFIGGAALLNIVLNALFIPFWGSAGAATATAISAAFWNLGLSVSMKRLTGLNSTIFSLIPIVRNRKK